MNQVTFHKHTLRKVLDKNLAEHRKQYEESVELYKSATKTYHDKLAEIATGSPMSIPRYDPPEKPNDYSKHYLDAIEMLTYEVNDVVTLSSRDFKQLVKDEWDWKSSFFAADAKNYSYVS